MNRQTLLLLAVVVAFVVFGGVVSDTTDWKSAKNADRYLPLLNAAEKRYGIPNDLLARIAYQESRFRDDIVSGQLASVSGALGLMQLVPRFHPAANPLDVQSAITYAAAFLSALRQQLGSWRLAVAGYNAGAGNVLKYAGIPPFEETRRYVDEITRDVPV